MVEVVYNLGFVFCDWGDWDEVFYCFEKVLFICFDYVDCCWDWVLSLFNKGDYEIGFVEYEWCWKLDWSLLCGYSQLIWDGFDFKGKIILVY